MGKNSEGEQARRAVFKKNLDDLMVMRGFDEQQLAQAMCLKLEGRKWLKRVCNRGLARASKASTDNLILLTETLGLTHPDDFWMLPEKEPFSLRQIRHIETMLREVDSIAAQKMRQEIETQLQEWCVRAEELRNSKADRLKWVAEAKIFKRELGGNWDRICARVAVQERKGFSESNAELFNWVVDFGVEMMNASFHEIHFDLFSTQRPSESLMAELLPVWGKLCDAFAANKPHLNTPRKVYEAVRRAANTRRAISVVGDLKRSCPYVGWRDSQQTDEDLDADSLLRRIEQKSPQAFVEAVRFLGGGSLRDLVERSIRDGHHEDLIVEKLVDRYGP